MIRIDTNDQNITYEEAPTHWGESITLYNGEPFTGIMEEYFSDNPNQLMDEAEYREGILHGRQAEYFSNGQIKYEGPEFFNTTQQEILESTYEYLKQKYNN